MTHFKGLSNNFGIRKRSIGCTLKPRVGHIIFGLVKHLKIDLFKKLNNIKLAFLEEILTKFNKKKMLFNTNDANTKVSIASLVTFQIAEHA